MLEETISLIAMAEIRHNGYVDAPPSGVTAEIRDELILCGLAVSRSDHLWVDGWRIYSSRALRAGLYREYVPQSTFTRVASVGVRVPTLDEIENITQAELPTDDLNGIPLTS
jgi:hypothetical protein